MADCLFTSDGYWSIGAETKAAIPQSEFPSDIVAMIDLVTAQVQDISPSRGSRSDGATPTQS